MDQLAPLGREVELCSNPGEGILRALPIFRICEGRPIVERQFVATVPGKRAISGPDLRDRLYELPEHDHLPHSVGSRFAQAIVAIIVLNVLAMILASVPEFDTRFG
jgi:hypothetical protein